MTDITPPADTERAALLADVAAVKGLSVAQAARLQGSTREELLTDADALRALFPTVPLAPTPPLSGGPRGGDVGGTAGSVTDGEALYHAKNPPREQRQVTDVGPGAFAEPTYRFARH